MPTPARTSGRLNLLEETLALQRAKLRPDHPATLETRLSIASIKVKLGRAAEAAADCRQAAEAFEKLNRTDANSLYNAACFRALLASGPPRGPPTAESTKREPNEEADRAMTLAQKGRRGGLSQCRALLSKDHDLDALRDRDDFKKLLERSSIGRSPQAVRPPENAGRRRRRSCM